jgi:hypothetical protein
MLGLYKTASLSAAACDTLMLLIFIYMYFVQYKGHVFGPWFILTVKE